MQYVQGEVAFISQSCADTYLGEKREIKKMSKMDDDDKDKNKSILFINKSLAQKDSCLKGYF